MQKLIIILLLALPFVLDAQMTYVPDDNFEQVLIDLGYDSGPLNDSIPTKNIDTVTYLNVSFKNIRNLKGIEDFIALQKLNCSNNFLMNLDISKNTELIDLDCNFTFIDNLDVRKNSYMQQLVCYSNFLTVLDVSNNLDLTGLYCNNNSLLALDVSNNSNLTELYCSNNSISILDVSKNLFLKLLGCSNNQLISLVVKNKPNLKSLLCNNNQLRELELSNNPKLEDFNSTNNSLLICIQVDDTNFYFRNFNFSIDSTAHYSTDCNYTGVDDFKFEDKSVSISPNPAADFIEINVPPLERGLGGVSGVRIFDILGIEQSTPSVLRTATPQEGNFRIDVSGLSPGVYFVRVGDFVQRFIKY